MEEVLKSEGDFDFVRMRRTDIDRVCDFLSKEHASNHVLGATYGNDPEAIKPYLHHRLSTMTYYDFSVLILHRPSGELCGALITNLPNTTETTPSNNKMYHYISFFKFLRQLCFEITPFKREECLFPGMEQVSARFKGNRIGLTAVYLLLDLFYQSKYKYLVFTATGPKGRYMNYELRTGHILENIDFKDFTIDGKKPFEHIEGYARLFYIENPRSKL